MDRATGVIRRPIHHPIRTLITCFFHEARIAQRSVDGLIGIAAGLTADNQVNQQEAEFLKRWMEQQLVHLEDPVINLLYRRLSDMLKDNMLDAAESAELLELLQQFTGKPRCSDNPFFHPPHCHSITPNPHWSGQAVCSCLPAQWLTGLAKHAKRW
jgi:hypothetical protein